MQKYRLDVARVSLHWWQLVPTPRARFDEGPTGCITRGKPRGKGSCSSGASNDRPPSGEEPEGADSACPCPIRACAAVTDAAPAANDAASNVGGVELNMVGAEAEAVLYCCCEAAAAAPATAEVTPPLADEVKPSGVLIGGLKLEAGTDRPAIDEGSGAGPGGSMWESGTLLATSPPTRLLMPVVIGGAPGRDAALNRCGRCCNCGCGCCGAKEICSGCIGSDNCCC